MATVGAIFLLLGAAAAERRLAFDEARRAREEATDANLAKSEFLAVMSHELRTPLNAIAGFAQLLELNVHGTLNEQQLHDVERITHNEQQLLAIIDEVLGFVSAEKGEAIVESQEMKVADAFNAVEPVMQSELQQKHLVLQRTLAPPQIAVHADPKSLQQILVRLLSNASKYTNDGGTITLGAERDGETVRIWVADTGVGISREEMQRVFEPFFQAERGATRRYWGSGWDCRSRGARPPHARRDHDREQAGKRHDGIGGVARRVTAACGWLTSVRCPPRRRRSRGSRV